MLFRNRFWPISCTLLLITTISLFAQEAKIKPGQRELGRAMLSDTMWVIRNNYYDPKFHGVDLQARYKETLEQINQASSANQILGQIAWFVDSLNDSHTVFVPPPQMYRVQYGLEMQMIGDLCYVTRVKPDSDAEKKGLKPGDQITAIDGVETTRETLYKLWRVINVLRPQLTIHVDVVSQTGEHHSLDIDASVTPPRGIGTNGMRAEMQLWEKREDLYKRKSVRLPDGVMIWKLYNFMMAEKGADNMISDARGSKALVLDLRGNRGGSALAVDRLIGNFFQNDVKVAEPEGRKKPSEVKDTAKGRGAKAYTGPLIVLLDSDSASASEILARVVQLEGRAKIVGDRSAGRVMLSQFHSGCQTLGCSVFYGVSVTHADLIMKDGKSLENVGVTPDVTVRPTPEDLAGGRDPALAKAIELAGGRMTAEDAGKLFPYQWPPQ